MSNSSLDTLVLRREPGSDWLENFKRTTRGTYYDSIEEFIANSFDADARTVRVTYDQNKANHKESSLIIEDDGHGMDEKGLESFFRVGDSPKKNKQSSPSGRHLIGVNGIATLGLTHLGKQYELVTSMAGEDHEWLVSETFNEILDPKQKINAIKKGTDEGKRGTTIIIKNLNFREDEDFSLDVLRNNLSWKYLPNPEFKVVINGEEVISKIPKHSRVFELQEIKGHKTGKIKGKAFYMNKPSDELAGTYIYVNGRQVGDPKKFVDLSKIDPAFEKFLVLQIYANELAGQVQFDRRAFTDSDATDEIRTYIRNQWTKPIKDWIRKKSTGQKVDIISRNLPRMIDEVNVDINNSETLDDRVGITISLGKTDDNLPGNYDPLSGDLVINQNYAGLIKTSQTKPEAYQVHLLHATIDTIAYKEAMNKGGNQLKKYMEIKADILRSIKGQELTTLGELKTVLGTAYYDTHELVPISDVSRSTIENMIDAGLLKYGEHGILGQDFEEAMNETKGFVSFFDIMKDYRNEKGLDSNSHGKERRRIEEKLKEAGDAISPFIKNFSKYEDNHFYMVERRMADIVIETVMESKTGSDIAESLKQLGKKKYATSTISKMTSMNQDDITRIVNYALRNDLEIKQAFEDDTNKYMLGDFIKVLQIYRKNESKSLSN